MCWTFLFSRASQLASSPPNMFDGKGEKEKSECEKDDLAPVLNEYRIRTQNAEQTIFKKQNMISASTFTGALLQESQHDLKPQNKAITLLTAELFIKSKQASPGCPPPRTHKFGTSVPKHLSSPELEVDLDVTSWIKQEVSELKQFPTTKSETG